MLKNFEDNGLNDRLLKVTQQADVDEDFRDKTVLIRNFFLRGDESEACNLTTCGSVDDWTLDQAFSSIRGSWKYPEGEDLC